MIGFIVMRMGEKRGGWPFFKKRSSAQTHASDCGEISSSGEEDSLKYPKKAASGGATVGVKSVDDGSK